MSERRVVLFQCLKDAYQRPIEIAGILRAGKLAPKELTVVQTFEKPTDRRLLDGATHVVIGGSGWSPRDDIPHLRDLQETIRRGVMAPLQIPTLGICFGGQLLAELFGGLVTRDPNREERGTIRIKLRPATRRDDIFHTARETILVQASHRDRILSAPPRSTVLATSQGGEVVQAFVLDEFRCWGVQFHPERSRAEVLRLLEPSLSGLAPERAGEIGRGLHPTPAAARLLERFFRL